jgi:hypothetical protein
MEPSISLGQSHSPITRVIKTIIQLVQYNVNVVLTPINDHKKTLLKSKQDKKNNQCKCPSLRMSI